MKIVSSKTPTTSAYEFCKLAKFYGAAPEFLNLERCCDFVAATRHLTAGDATALIFDLDSFNAEPTSRVKLPSLSELEALNLPILLIGEFASPRSVELLRSCTGGILHDIRLSSTTGEVRFPCQREHLKHELCGHSFPRLKAESVGFSVQSPAQTIMEVNGNASFVLVSGKIFAWATPSVFDIERPLATELEFENAAETYIPGIFFTRYALGKRCWHNPHKYAALTIDDPLLEHRYGFIDFGQLLASARKHGYRVGLAFIPWNHWRVRERGASLFRSYQDCFDLCVHGCDHTNHEFRSNNYETLVAKNYLATKRMDKLSRRFNLPYAPVFVCPQEQCSTVAWKAFADTAQFLGMINTSCIPRDLQSPTVRGADLLAPAQDSFFGFPVFKRHYWKDMSAYAMALFLGKPAILVEHHQFFRDGCRQMEEFAAQLKVCDERIRWEPLSSITKTTHWRRSSSDDETEIRFFTRVFEFSHSGDRPHLYKLSKRVAGGPTILHIAVNGVAVSFESSDGIVEFAIHAKPSETFNIALGVQGSDRPRSIKFGWRYHAGVLSRRALAELRDNLVSRNAKALKIASTLMAFLNLTGSSRTRNAEKKHRSPRGT